MHHQQQQYHHHHHHSHNHHHQYHQPGSSSSASSSSSSLSSSSSSNNGALTSSSGGGGGGGGGGSNNHYQGHLPSTNAGSGGSNSYYPSSSNSSTSHSNNHSNHMNHFSNPSHHSSNSSIQSHSHAAASSTAAAITSNDWIFTRRDLETNTPSRHDGMTEETELDRRTRGCVFIATVGLALELPQYAITSAEVYFHRYFIRESFKQHQHIDVAAACLFLATKVEEQGRKLSTVIAVCAQKAAKNDNLRIDDTTREFWRWRDRITLYEELVLSSLCFDLNVDQPYELILKLGNEMKLSDSVKTAAMAFVNDGYRTTWLCLMYRAKEIGLAALFVASIFVGQELVSSTSEAVTFFQLHEVQPRNVFEAAELLVKAHSNSSGDGGPGGGNGASKSNHSPVVRDPGPPPRRTVS